MPRILILADDLSGAADCGIACVYAGLKTVVTLGPPSVDATVDAVAIDADTRGLDAPAAAERMRRLVRDHARDPALLLFKKIDSTLRGHLGEELAAVLETRRVAVPRTVAIVAPAFPANGRTTVGGMHYVYGEPLHKTEIWKREKMPGEAYIARMLEGQGLVCGQLNLARARGVRGALGCAVRDAAETADVIVCDAETDEDLRAIANAAVSLEGRALWVGSAGLARQMPWASGLALGNKDGAAPVHEAEICGPILFVIGSVGGAARQQVATLLSSSDICGIVVPPEVLLEGPGCAAWEAFASQLCEAAALEKDMILVCGSEPEVDPADRARLSQALGEMAATLKSKVGGLVASGGETARKVLDRWGVLNLQLHGELEIGVPISSAVVDGTRPITVITKAGDFGQRESLLHCREWLSKRGAFR